MFYNSSVATKLLLASFNRMLMFKHSVAHSYSHRTRQRNKALPELSNNSVAIGNSHLPGHNLFNCNVLSPKAFIAASGYLGAKISYKSIFTGNFVTPCLHGGITAALIAHTAENAIRHFVGNMDADVHLTDLRFDYLAPAPCFEDILCDAVQIGRDGRHSCCFVVDLVCWNHSRKHKLVLGRVQLTL